MMTLGFDRIGSRNNDLETFSCCYWPAGPSLKTRANQQPCQGASVAFQKVQGAAAARQPPPLHWVVRVLNGIL